MKALLTITICLCLIAALTPAASAGSYIIPSEDELTVSATYTTNVKAKAVDNDTLTAWNAGNCNGWIEWSNPNHRNISGVRIHNGMNAINWYSNSNFLAYSTTANDAWTNITFLGNYTTGPVKYVDADCPSWTNVNEYMFIEETYDVSVDFTADPTSGPASLYVLLTDASYGYSPSATWNWSITPTTGVTGPPSSTFTLV